MLLPALSLLLGHRQSVVAAPVVTAFGIYSNLSIMAPATRYGVLVIVRRALSDGTTVTDVGTFPAAPALGRTMSTHLLSRGRIVRDANGSTVTMDLRATNAAGVVGTSHWERVQEEKKDSGGTDEENADAAKPTVLKGEMDRLLGGHRTALLPEDAFYSLGTVEALTLNPNLSTWRVPSVGGMSPVFIPSTATQYHREPGTEGIYLFGNQNVRLRVCPITFDGPLDRMTVNGRLISTNVRALALYDVSGRLMGFGSRAGLSEDIESTEAEGTTGDLSRMRGSHSAAPDPFLSDVCPMILSCLAREEPSPIQAAAYLRAMD